MPAQKVASTLSDFSLKKGFYGFNEATQEGITWNNYENEGDGENSTPEESITTLTANYALGGVSESWHNDSGSNDVAGMVAGVEAPVSDAGKTPIFSTQVVKISINQYNYSMYHPLSPTYTLHRAF